MIMATAIVGTTKPRIETEKKVRTPVKIQTGPNSFKTSMVESVEKVRFKMLGVRITVNLDSGESYSWKSFLVNGSWGTWKREECTSASKNRHHAIGDVLADLYLRGVDNAEGVILDAIEIQDNLRISKQCSTVHFIGDEQTEDNGVYSFGNGFIFTDEVGSPVFQDYCERDFESDYGIPWATEDEAQQACDKYYAGL
jgi:hypothetical protein